MQGFLRHLIVPALALAGMALAPAPGRAEIVFFESLADYRGYLKGNGIPVENVLFDDQVPAKTVQGHTSVSDVSVDITGTENLMVRADQEEVDGSDGLITNATFTADALTTLAFVIKTKAETGGDFTLSVNGIKGPSIAASDAVNRQLFFGAIDTTGRLIESATITATGNSIANINSIRIGAGGTSVTAVPEASSLAMMGVVVTAATAVGLLRRARKPVA